MRLAKIAAAAALLSLTSGCTMITSDLRQSGGFAGRVLDRRMFDASSSKRLQLLRMTMIVALASRVAQASIRDGREAEAFVDYLSNAVEEVNFLAGHLYGQAARAPRNAVGDLPPRAGRDRGHTCDDLRSPQPAPDEPAAAAAAGQPAPPHTETATPGQPAPPAPRCDTYSALFEADMPMLEYKVFRLVVAALPQREAQRFVNAARTGNPLAAAWRFLQLAAIAADGFHRGAAVYRSSQEILAIAVVAAANDTAPRCAVPLPGRALNDRIQTVEHAVACLGLAPNRVFSRPNGHLLRLPQDFGEDPFQALFEIIRTSCATLPLPIDITDDDAKLNARRVACANLSYDPQLRFGGRTFWERYRSQ
jgi:hypothetical protein